MTARTTNRVSHTHSVQHPFTARLLALLPVVLFVLQIVGRFYILGTVVAGVLVCTKAVMDWVSSSHQEHSVAHPPFVGECCALCESLYDRHDLLLLTVTQTPFHVCKTCYHASSLSQCYVS